MARFSTSGGSGAPGPQGPAGQNANTANFIFNENEMYTETGNLEIYTTGAPDEPYSYNRIDIGGDRVTADVTESIYLTAGEDVELTAGNNANAKSWYFKGNGNLEIPTGGDILVREYGSYIGIETTYEVQGGTSGTQPTFNGSPLFFASYIKMYNNLVHFQIQVDMDNITSFGTGQYYVTLPFNAKYAYQFREGCLHDIGGEDQFQISGHVAEGSNMMYLFWAQQNAQDEPFTSTAPVTLQTNDNFHIAGTYIAAQSL